MAWHFRSFNLVIERLLISGTRRGCKTCVIPCFNLVIERLLISGPRIGESTRHSPVTVSISLSSGFSFQGSVSGFLNRRVRACFNLVIERLLISGQRTVSQPLECHYVSISLSSGFSFQALSFSNCSSRFSYVSISLSSGFSFQVFLHVVCYVYASSFQSRYRAASHFR